MSTAEQPSLTQHDDAFYRKRKALLIFPMITIPFAAALFAILEGGKGVSNTDQIGPIATGFNAKMSNADNKGLASREVDRVGYGEAKGQLLSDFTDSRKDTALHGFRSLPVDDKGEVGVPVISTRQVQSSPEPATPGQYTSYRTQSQSRGGNRPANKPFEYHPPGQTESVATYEAPRVTQPVSNSETATADLQKNAPKTGQVQVSDHVMASRLGEHAAQVESPFNTATVGIRPEEQMTILGSNSYNRRVISKLVPVVVHEDQVVRAGQPVKLRLTKSINVDGTAVPANTILHAVCKPNGDRLQLVVQSVQLRGQLIPLDMEAYDTDGAAGVNVPGLSDQLSPQMKSSAVTGVHVPTRSGLLNTVMSTIRMGASTAMRQPTIRLKGGYNLYLKGL